MRAHGRPDLEADLIIEGIVREMAPKVLDRARELFRSSYADSPECLAILFGPEPLPTERSAKLAEVSRRKVTQRAWIERQTEHALARATVDDFRDRPEAVVIASVATLCTTNARRMRALERMRAAKSAFTHAASAAMHGDAAAAELVQRALAEVNAARYELNSIEE